MPRAVLPQACAASATLIDLPRRCHLTYEEDACEPALLRLIDSVPADLWGARLALQVRAPAAAASGARGGVRACRAPGSRADACPAAPRTAQVLAQRALGEQSAFSAYLQTLPARFSGIPLFFSAEAMKILGQYPPVSEQVRGLRHMTVLYIAGGAVYRRCCTRRPWCLTHLCLQGKSLFAWL